MVRALDAEAYVRQGVWTNWERGSVRGLTVSLSQQNATILAAALALFIQMIGSRLWIILRFAVHQSRVTTQARPAWYHQQQSLLRNSTSALDFLGDLVAVARRWRKNLGQLLSPFLVLSLSTMVYVLAVAVLGVLSSQLVKVDDQVVFSSPYCLPALTGISNKYTDDTNFTQLVARTLYASSQVLDSMKYAHSCYLKDVADDSACARYAVPRISYNISRNATCPFQAKVCHRQATATTFDTGVFDVGLTLGINMRDRAYARKVVTCIPLNDTVYVKVNEGRSVNGLNISRAYYGPQSGDLSQNSTYSHTAIFFDMTSDQLEYIRAYEVATLSDYQSTASFNTTLDPKMQLFDPIDELSHPRSDLSLTFMNFPGWYSAIVDDPWFSAHLKREITANTTAVTNTARTYHKDTPISTMGCVDQYQLCLNDPANCTRLGSVFQTVDEIDLWDSSLTQSQIQAFKWVLRAFIDTGTNHVFTQSGGEIPLLANDKTVGAISTALPANQWQLEAEYWFTISLAWLQSLLVDLGTGQYVSDVSFINTTASKTQRNVCDNMMIRGTKIQSFNLFALIIILVVGLLIIILSLSVEKISGILQQRYRRGLTRKQMWEANSLLQLQRMAYEHKGEGTWAGSGGIVPRTKLGELLSPLEVGVNDGKETVDRPSLSTQTTLMNDKTKATSDQTSLISGMENGDNEAKLSADHVEPVTSSVESRLPPLIWSNDIRDA